MTELSPAAQAVLDALDDQFYELNSQHLAAAVAALRAAAEVAIPIEYEKIWKDGRMEEYEVESLPRKKLLEIVNELEKFK